MYSFNNCKFNKKKDKVVDKDKSKMLNNIIKLQMINHIYLIQIQYFL